MIAHTFKLEDVPAKSWRTAGGKPGSAVRWRCSCGRVGPDVLPSEADRARRGGERHVAAMERGR